MDFNPVGFIAFLFFIFTLYLIYKVLTRDNIKKNNKKELILLDSINNTIHGDELTSFNSLNKSCCLFGSLIGGAIGVAIGNHLDINTAIILQAIMVAINSVSELYAFYKLDSM